MKSETMHNSKTSFVTVELTFFTVLLNYSLFMMCKELHLHTMNMQGAKSDKPDTCPESPFCHLVQSQDKEYSSFVELSR